MRRSNLPLTLRCEPPQQNLFNNVYGYTLLKERQYFVYIITNRYHTVLYTGVTYDLQRGITQHKFGKGGKFSSTYHLDKLVYYEVGTDIIQAIVREKQIKGGSRQKKIDLIESINPNWEDLFDKYFM